MASPSEIVRAARVGSAIVGWKLQSREREKLLRRFPPRYSTTIADHVTLIAKVAADTPMPDDTDALLVGCVDNGEGVEALVVEIKGSTARPGGGIWHVTWSLAEGRRARESNDVLKQFRWCAFKEPVPVRLVGAHIR